MSRTYSIPAFNIADYDKLLLSPQTEAELKITERVVEDTNRALFGMPVRSSPFLSADTFILDGPRQMAIGNTKTGKVTVVDKQPFVLQPLRLDPEPKDIRETILRSWMPVLAPRFVYVTGLPADIGPKWKLTRRQKDARRWRGEPHARKRDRRR